MKTKITGQCYVFVQGMDLTCPLCGVTVESGKEHRCEAAEPKAKTKSITTVKQMVALARSANKKLYIRAIGKSGVLGVFEVYPGGRTIFWSSDKGRVFERKLSEALQDVIFKAREKKAEGE